MSWNCQVLVIRNCHFLQQLKHVSSVCTSPIENLLCYHHANVALRDIDLVNCMPPRITACRLSLNLALAKRKVRDTNLEMQCLFVCSFHSRISSSDKTEKRYDHRFSKRIGMLVNELVTEREISRMERDYADNTTRRHPDQQWAGIVRSCVHSTAGAHAVHLRPQVVAPGMERVETVLPLLSFNVPTQIFTIETLI